ncbi:MAG: hypothetical protein LBS74_09400 [Oscillospiraceae bacterium]|nr:hypothetical protein [Oscillospiraceae bacterium]
MCALMLAASGCKKDEKVKASSNTALSPVTALSPDMLPIKNAGTVKELVPAIYCEFTDEQWAEVLPDIASAIKHKNPDAELLLRQGTGVSIMRTRIMCWNKLREFSVFPNDEEKNLVLGVVLEVTQKGGTDYLAAWADNNAVYYNYGGYDILYDLRSSEVNRKIQTLIANAQNITPAIALLEGARPADVPPEGSVRINIITPAGIRSITGDMNALSENGLTDSVVSQGIVVMTGITDYARELSQQAESE